MLTSFFTFAALPPPSKDSAHKSTFERLSAVAINEGSIKFLQKSEFLHQFGLLHSSPSIQSRDAPSSQAEASNAPVSAEEPAPKELIVET